MTLPVGSGPAPHRPGKAAGEVGVNMWRAEPTRVPLDLEALPS